MKRLSAIWMFIIVFSLISDNAFAQTQYLIDGANPASVSEDHSVTITLDPAGIINTPLITAGCWIEFDATYINITNVVAADSDVGGPWDPSYTYLLPEGGGPGTFFIAVGNFDTVPVDTPIPICDIQFDCVAFNWSEIIISTIPNFDTVVSYGGAVWDPDITNGIILPRCAHPCMCFLEGPATIQAACFELVTEQYIFECINDCKPPNYVWSDDCTQVDIDQNGLLVIPPATGGETCTITVIDLANTDINTREPISGNIPVEILDAGSCECEGDFDCDGDCDGSDAGAFKIDFGRSGFIDPCTNEDQCHGDFDCDVDVDGTDAALFKADFGRSSFDNPCPACEVGDWCSYPSQ
jgi:hypothetical protein